MKKNTLQNYVLAGIITTTSLFSEITVDTSHGILDITSDISGTVIAKIIGPNDNIVIDERYEGSSFTWVPSGIDGAYRYEVRLLTQKKEERVKKNHVAGIMEIVSDTISEINEEKR